MRLTVLLQTALILILGQGILGAIGFLLRDYPWIGLPLPFLYVWFVVRTALVIRQEYAKSLRKTGVPLPWRQAALIVLVWQGAMLPLVMTLGWFWSAVSEAALPWLWTVGLVQAALFLWPALRPVAAPPPPPMPAVKPTATGEWAPARLAPKEGRGNRRTNRRR